MPIMNLPQEIVPLVMKDPDSLREFFGISLDGDELQKYVTEWVEMAGLEEIAELISFTGIREIESTGIVRWYSVQIPGLLTASVNVYWDAVTDSYDYEVGTVEFEQDGYESDSDIEDIVIELVRLDG